MGWGDELMAAGQAARASRETGKRVCILHASGEARFHELWDGLEFISPAKLPGCVSITNSPGARPYIAYPFTSAGHGYTGWRARDHRPVISARLAGERKDLGFVLIEPTIKRQANPNKYWPRWQEVVDALPDVKFVQCGPINEPSHRLRGGNLRYVITPTFIDAVRLLNQASAFVGAEGGMHHAAAALNVPAVVIFGGSPSVQATGYPDHKNFGGTDPCGRWEPCAHCAQTMNAITPDQVVQALKETLK